MNKQTEYRAERQVLFVYYFENGSCRYFVPGAKYLQLPFTATQNLSTAKHNLQ